LPGFNKTWFFSAEFRNSSYFKFHEHSSSGSRVLPCGRTDGQTDMTKLIGAFHNFAKAPKNRTSHLWHSIIFMIRSYAFRELTFVTLYSFYDQSSRENKRNFIYHWSMKTKSLTMKTLRWPLLFCSIISSKRIINRAYVSNRLRTTVFRWSQARIAIKQWNNERPPASVISLLPISDCSQLMQYLWHLLRQIYGHKCSK